MREIAGGSDSKEPDGAWQSRLHRVRGVGELGKGEERKWEESVRREGGWVGGEGIVVEGGGSGGQNEEGSSDQGRREDSPSSSSSSAGVGGTCGGGGGGRIQTTGSLIY